MSTAVTSSEATAAPVGITPTPMPQLNGTLRQAPGAPQIYLVLNGLRCWIPDMTTLTNLFLPGVTAVSDPNLDQISVGNPLTSGAVLGQADGTAPAYLITNGVKMWIPDSNTFNAYQFNSKCIQFVQPVLIDFIPIGPNVEGPTTT
jgi:hypothetical protein